MLIGGGGISEAEDTKAAAGDSLRYPAGTGMAPASLLGHRPRAKESGRLHRGERG